MKKYYSLAILLSLAFISGEVLAACPDGQVCIDNPLGSNASSLQVFIGQLIKGALGIIGSLALLMFTYGGFVWMFSQGDSKKVQEGKDIFLWASIGLAIVFSSYTLAQFVFKSILGT